MTVWTLHQFTAAQKDWHSCTAAQTGCKQLNARRAGQALNGHDEINTNV